MYLSKKNIAFSLAVLVLLSLGALGMHQRHHLHRHGYSRRCCSTYAGFDHVRRAAIPRIHTVVPAIERSEVSPIPHSTSSSSTHFKRIFSIRPPPIC